MKEDVKIEEHCCYNWLLYKEVNLFSSFLKKPPISVTGAFVYGLQLFNPKWCEDIVYKNPQFSSDTKDSIGIYCIHGTMDRVHAFDYFAKCLVKKLPASVSSIHLVAFKYRGQGLSIEAFANQLLEKIKFNKHHRVILIGHSRGGLIAAYLTEYLARAANIEVIGNILIGTPLNGTWLALPPVLWVSISVQQMRKKSPFLINLQKEIQASRVHYRFYAAENDSVVEPTSACVTGRENDLTIFKEHGHLSLLWSEQLVDSIPLEQLCQPEPLQRRSRL